MKKIAYALLLMIFVFMLYFGFYHNRRSFNALRVAHAGGGINDSTYTNSYNALNLNIKNGFKYFELDFSFTKDGELVCLHDWTHSFQRSFGFSVDEKVTLQEFKHLVATKSKFEKCTLDGLSVWMEDNPSAYLVTDVKENNYKALQMIAKEIKDSYTRVIPQVYDPNNLQKIKQLGYKQIIWTLYRYQGDDSNVLEWVSQFEKPFAVTMPKQRAVTSLPKELQRKGIPTYVHTVNSTQEKEKFLNKFFVTEIYTDFL